MYNFFERLPLHSVAELQLLGHMALPRTAQPTLRHDHLIRHMNHLQSICKYPILRETEQYDALQGSTVNISFKILNCGCSVFAIHQTELELPSPTSTGLSFYWYSV